MVEVMEYREVEDVVKMMREGKSITVETTNDLMDYLWWDGVDPEYIGDYRWGTITYSLYRISMGSKVYYIFDRHDGYMEITDDPDLSELEEVEE